MTFLLLVYRSLDARPRARAVGAGRSRTTTARLRAAFSAQIRIKNRGAPKPFFQHSDKSCEPQAAAAGSSHVRGREPDRARDQLGSDALPHRRIRSARAAIEEPLGEQAQAGRCRIDEIRYATARPSSPIAAPVRAVTNAAYRLVVKNGRAKLKPPLQLERSGEEGGAKTPVAWPAASGPPETSAKSGASPYRVRHPCKLGGPAAERNVRKNGSAIIRPGCPPGSCACTAPCSRSSRYGPGTTAC